jgi:hypothetical protein
MAEERLETELEACRHAVEGEKNAELKAAAARHNFSSATSAQSHQTTVARHNQQQSTSRGVHAKPKPKPKLHRQTWPE